MLRSHKFQSDWYSKSLVGLLLGFTLAVAVAGIFAWGGTGGIAMPNKSQFVIWLIAPVWLSVLAGVYMFQSARQALIWLGAINIVAYLVLSALKAAGAVP